MSDVDEEMRSVSGVRSCFAINWDFTAAAASTRKKRDIHSFDDEDLLFL